MTDHILGEEGTAEDFGRPVRMGHRAATTRLPDIIVGTSRAQPTVIYNEGAGGRWMPELPLCRRRGSLPGSPPFFPASPAPGGPILQRMGSSLRIVEEPDFVLGADRHRPQPFQGRARSGGVHPIGVFERTRRVVMTSQLQMPGMGRREPMSGFFMRRKKAGHRCPAFCVRAAGADYGPGEKPLTPGVRIRRSMSTRSSLSRSKSPSISKISSPGVIGLPGPVRLMMAV